MRLQTLSQCGFYFGLRSIRIADGEDTGNAVVRFALEILNLTFALNNESYSNALHTTGRESRLYLAPQNGRESETYQTVKYTTGLLSVH